MSGKDKDGDIELASKKPRSDAVSEAEIFQYREHLKKLRAEEEVFFEGRGGPFKLYNYRITSRTIRVTSLFGFKAIVSVTLSTTVGFGLIGMLASLAIFGVIIIPFAVAGFLVGLAYGLFAFVRREVNTMETRFLTDVGVKKSWRQNAKNDGTCTVQLYSLDPSTPYLEAKIPQKGEELYQLLVRYLRGRETGLGKDAPEPTWSIDREFGRKICVMRGCYGLLPRRRYRVSDEEMEIEKFHCMGMTRDHVRRDKIYDMSLHYNCLQVLMPKKIGKGKGTLLINTFDTSGAQLSIKMTDAEQTFDELRKRVDCKAAADKWWENMRVAGFMNDGFGDAMQAESDAAAAAAAGGGGGGTMLDQATGAAQAAGQAITVVL